MICTLSSFLHQRSWHFYNLIRACRVLASSPEQTFMTAGSVFAHPFVKWFLQVVTRQCLVMQMLCPVCALAFYVECTAPIRCTEQPFVCFDDGAASNALSKKDLVR